MSGEDVERFEAAAGELLEELGYPRAVSSPRPEALEHASKMRDSLAQDPSWNKIVLRPQAQILEGRSTIRELLAETRGNRSSLAV